MYILILDKIGGSFFVSNGKFKILAFEHNLLQIRGEK